MADSPLRFSKLKAEHRFEPDRIKGSRFMACAAPIQSHADGEALLASVRAEFPSAGHHCYAWVVDPAGHETRANDDGEPGSSAGLPILRQIQGHELAGTAVVVARWFGGTKLGVGGLVRAYGGTAGQCLDRAEVLEVRVQQRGSVRFPYACAGVVESTLQAHEATTLGSDYGEAVELHLSVPLERWRGFVAELIERTAGLAKITPD